MNIDTLNQYKDQGLLMNQFHPTHPLIIWNYTPKVQYEQLWDEITRQCRALVTDLDGTIVSRGFSKFFNIEEDRHEPTDEFEIFEKLDGCCFENTILETEDGYKTIREICETKYQGKVLSFNHDLEVLEFKSIDNWMIGSETDDWYEIECNDGTFLQLTGNHKIWINELQCYRTVDDLKTNFKNYTFMKK